MFQVRQLLELSSFSESTVVAGHSGLSRSIGDLSVMEVPDIENYIRPGSFLLSTLYPLSGQPDRLEHLIPQLDAAQLSGIGIKLNRYVSELPAVCLEQADRLGFPVLILPADSDFSLQINDYLSARIQQNNMELQHRNYVHEKCMEILLRGGNPDDLAHILSGILHRTVVLIGKDFEQMAARRSRADRELELEQLGQMCREALPEREVMYAPLPEGYAAIYALRYSAENVGYIAVCDRTAFQLKPLELITLQQFAIVFRVILQRNIMLKNQEYRNRELFFCDLIYNTVCEQEVALARARMFRWQLTFPVAILLVQIPNMVPVLQERQDMLSLLQQKIEWEFYPDSPRTNTFWVENRSSIAVVLNQTAVGDGDRIASRVTALLLEWNTGEFYMALSREASDLSRISQAYHEARYTLKLARQMKHRGLMKFRDLGVYRIISSAQNQQDLRDFCMDTIGALVDYDRQHNSDLIRTLETIIDHGGNLKAAAQALFVHYNTIRYRYRLIEKIFGKELNEPSTYQNISLALKVYQVLSAE